MSILKAVNNSLSLMKGRLKPAALLPGERRERGGERERERERGGGEREMRQNTM